MAKRVVRIVFVIAAGAVAAASIATIFVSAASAGDECLTKPNGGAPAGLHWRYRTDRNTKRQCWYLRDKDETSQAAAPTPLEQTTSPVRKSDSNLTRATADAYAQLSSSVGRFENGSQVLPSADTKGVEQTPPRDASPAGEQSPVISRWPVPSDVLAATNERPAMATFAVASTAPDSSAATNTDAAQAAPDVSSDKGDVPASQTTATLQLLLLAAFGTLLFAGGTGGAIYLARARRRLEPDVAVSSGPGWSPPDDDHRLYAPARLKARAFDSPHRADRLTSGLSENGHEIAQLLARFANQAEAKR